MYALNKPNQSSCQLNTFFNVFEEVLTAGRLETIVSSFKGCRQSLNRPRPFVSNRLPVKRSSGNNWKLFVEKAIIQNEPCMFCPLVNPVVRFWPNGCNHATETIWRCNLPSHSQHVLLEGLEGGGVHGCDADRWSEVPTAGTIMPGCLQRRGKRADDSDSRQTSLLIISKRASGSN